MNCIANSKRALGLALTTALAGALLAGCTTKAAPPAHLSANLAEKALDGGKHGKAIAHAEAAVLAEPRTPEYRAMLASAYLDAGRFASAATSFDDAMQLGDNSPRTALSLALALMGRGRHDEAATLLNQWEGRIPVADHGLALALAGHPERGVHLMSDAIRGGENTVKMRQNLAYAYALAGRWREARLMAGQDLQGVQLGDRIEEWSRLVAPEAWHHRVAALLQVPAGVADAGQPVQLALANHPSIDQLGEEAQARAALESPQVPVPVLAESAAGELPALGTSAAAPARDSTFQSAFAAPAPAASSPAATPAAAQGPVTREALNFVRSPVVQTIEPRPASEPTALARVAQRTEGTHLVQLGSFASEKGARRAWNLYVKKYPELAAHDMVITEAVVRGKNYWRVSAAGFGRTDASSMCGKVRSTGQGCFAYSKARPLPGAVDSGIRMARR